MVVRNLSGPGFFTVTSGHPHLLFVPWVTVPGITLLITVVGGTYMFMTVVACGAGVDLATVACGVAVGCWGVGVAGGFTVTGRLSLLPPLGVVKRTTKSPVRRYVWDIEAIPCSPVLAWTVVPSSER